MQVDRNRTWAKKIAGHLAPISKRQQAPGGISCWLVPPGQRCSLHLPNRNRCELHFNQKSLCHGSQRTIGRVRPHPDALPLNRYPYPANLMTAEAEHPDDPRSVIHPADEFGVPSGYQPPCSKTRRPPCRMSEKRLRQPPAVRQMVFLQRSSGDRIKKFLRR